VDLLRSTSLVGEMAEKVCACLQRYRQIQESEPIAVALSGGKDSWTLLALLSWLRQTGKLANDLLALHIDLGFPEAESRLSALRDGCQSADVPLLVETTRIGPEAIADGGKRPCFLCARQRRKALYELAAANNARLIATGHHRDDVLASFLINLFENREISTLTPRQEIFAGQLILIRPLYDMPEQRIDVLFKQQKFPVVSSGCPIDGKTRRAAAEAALAALEQHFPNGRDALFTALHKVKNNFLPS